MRWFAIPILLSLVLISCESEVAPSDDTLTAPTTYDTTGYTGSTAELRAVVDAHASLVALLKVGRTPGALIDGPAVLEIWENGPKPLAPDVAPAFVQPALASMGKAVMSAGQTFDPSAAPTGTGGTLGPFGAAYLFDNTGLECEQYVDKGLYLALHYYQASLLLSAAPSAANVDRVVLLFGATPKFVNTYDASNPDRDKFSANYVCRRDKNDGKGMYTSIATNLKIMKGALADLGRYKDDYERAAISVRETWERGMMATVINYCMEATRKFNAATTDAERAGAMHSLSEAIGFVTGLRCVPSSARRATDAQLDEVLALCHVPLTETATPYLFFRDPMQLARLDNTTGVVAKLRTVYGFTAQDITDFEQNWVSQQGRK